MDMRGRSLLVALAWLTLIPAAAHAQGSIVGVVKDTSGAVLPGVTVEASSPALIEKTRTGITDATGQYRIENLRPGTYMVTYTLAGFSTVKREGIELEGLFTATVNAELRVGALEETVTVTGETPIVDVQGTTRQRVLGRDVVDSIPAGRGATGINALGLLIPGVSQGFSTAVQDVGGSAANTNVQLKAHGGEGSDQLITQNGVSIGSINATGYFNRLGINMAATKETTIDTSAVSAEYARGGVRINLIPKDGGNTFEGTFYGSFGNNSMQGNNLTQALKDRGLPTTNELKKMWDLNPGFGGPIKKDKVWFYLSGMYNGNQSYAAGMFENLNANNPNAWTYAPDLSRRAVNDLVWRDGQARLTWQVTPKNKLGLTWHEQVNCECPIDVSATRAPDGVALRRYPMLRQVQGDWMTPITSRVLVEVAALEMAAAAVNDPLPGLNPAMIAVTEQSNGLQYRSGDLTYRASPNQALHSRGAVSYITGAHAFKVGFNHTNGWASQYSAAINPITYRFNNGVPNQMTQAAYPYNWKTNVAHDLGLYTQDRWTVNRVTANYGIRFDWFKSSYPEQHLGPTLFTPTRDVTFPARDGVSLKDITPKLGVAYDLFGNGKTAVKVTLNRYVQGLASEGIASASNPVNLIIVSTTRAWTDANRNFVPDCNLNSAAANGECGAMAAADFGTTRPGAAYDPEVLAGWSKRFYNWEFSTGVQHEILPRVSVDVGYYRRWYGNFAVTDNLLAGPTDYTQYSIKAPVDPRLPGGGGYTISGFYDLNPNKVGQLSELITFGDNYGRMIRHWNGIDVSLNARPRNGLLVQGGFSTGRDLRDYCDVVAKLPEILFVSRSTGDRVGSLPTVGYLTGGNTSAEFCHQNTGFRTQVKALASYTIPKVDVLASATFQSVDGPQILAQYVASNAVVAPSLGRNLSGNAANATLGLVAPGSMYIEQSNQIDLRFGKVLKVVKTRTVLNFDLYNALNASPVLRQNDNFAAWQAPTVILGARLIKIGVQFDF